MVLAEALGHADERRLYELVVRHFLACCSDDARGHRTQVKAQMGGEHFSASGRLGEKEPEAGLAPFMPRHA
jgi:DNA topoisomerase-3